MSLELDLEKYLANLHLDLTTIKLGVACSAGVDSLSLLAALRPRAKNLYCLHLDHGLRDDSYKAREFLERYCAEHEIKFLVKEFKAGELKTSEEEAREARYKFFQDACLQHDIKNLFLAHNLNDNAETILFRIFRGTSTSGLKGIPEQRSLEPDIIIHRPLLNTERCVIEAYASAQALTYINDSSNENLKFARNRIRSLILPEAQKINPKVLANIQTLANLVREEQEFIGAAVEQALKGLGELPWSLDGFRKLDQLLQRKILEKTFTTNISFVNDFLEAIKQGGFHRINYSKDRFFTIKQKQIHLEVSS